MAVQPDRRNGTREKRHADDRGGPGGNRGARNGERHEKGNAKSGDSSPQRMSGTKAVRAAREILEELTGRQAETVASLVRTEEGWAVTLDIVETQKVPRTTDIMGSYVVEVDGEGELVRCERVSRFVRGQAVDE